MLVDLLWNGEGLELLSISDEPRGPTMAQREAYCSDNNLRSWSPSWRTLHPWFGRDDLIVYASAEAWAAKRDEIQAAAEAYR